jgi:hypothetical protein
VADRIPDAELVERRSDAEDLSVPARFLDRAREEHARRLAEPTRVLATVLFTDLVGSTARAMELGPRWQETLREHNLRIRRALARFNGREIDTAGDGFFASGFDGPARAIRCACTIRDTISELGLGVRVGVHTGECDIVDGKLSGLAVVTGHVWQAKLTLERCSSQARCESSWPAQGSNSRREARTSSRALAHGRCTPWFALERHGAGAEHHHGALRARQR